LKKNYSIPVICPRCKSQFLSEDVFKLSNTKLKCKNCNITFISNNGCYDFVFENIDEKKFYENRYYKNEYNQKKLDFDELYNIWADPYQPEVNFFLSEIKKYNIKNKTILLLGNGESEKELYFLNFGSRIIYSDLSMNSVKNVKNHYDFKEYIEKITFHAIDAVNLPFKTNSIDMVYGYAFIHHIDNLDRFFNEVYRVLKPKGLCLFLDNAHSPMLHILKWKLLPFITNFIQKNYETSPEDEKASLKGGFDQDELRNIMVKYKFQDIIFLRFGLFYWIFKRLPGVVFNWSEKLIKFQRHFIPLLFFIDSFISKRSSIYCNNTMKLIFGFKK